MGKTLGIIGGGQLGMMLTEAARRLTGEISDVIVLDPTENCPAAQAGAKQIVADFKDQKAIEELAGRSDIITYEIESGDSDVLKGLERDTVINPSPETLRIIQDKFLQKTELSKHGIGVAEFHAVESAEGLKESIREFGYPVLLKARRDAYDGRGNYKIDSEREIQAAYDFFRGQKLMVEKFVPFRMEVSVIAARSASGEIATFPLVENMHEDNILRTTVAPARVSDAVAKNAQRLAEKTMEVLHGAGVFGIEMFVTRDDGLLINEIAPRVHNSGHHSLQSSRTSQFEQHLRAIMGLPLGSTELVRPTIMYNILGEGGYEGRYTVDDPGIEGAFLKMYGKAVSKPKRKLGHINIVSKDGEGLAGAFEKLERVRSHPILNPAG